MTNMVFVLKQDVSQTFWESRYYIYLVLKLLYHIHVYVIDNNYNQYIYYIDRLKVYVLTCIGEVLQTLFTFST